MDSPECLDVTGDPSVRIEVSRELEHMLSMPPPLYRAVLVLRKANGMHYQEIATELNI